MPSRVRFGQPFSMRKRSQVLPTLVGHVLLAKKYPEERYWTYYVRLEGKPVCWRVRMHDRGQALLGLFVEFEDIRVDEPRVGFAGRASMIGPSLIDENVSRIVRNANATSSPRALPAQVQRVWLIGGNGEARGDLAARAPGVEIIPVKGSLLSAKELKRALLKTIERKDLDADHDVILLARGGGTEVVLLDCEEVARALAQASRRVATILAVGHARDELRIAALLDPQLVRTTPTDAAALFQQSVASASPLPPAPDVREAVQAPTVAPSDTCEPEQFDPPSPEPTPTATLRSIPPATPRPRLYLAMALLAAGALSIAGLWAFVRGSVEHASAATTVPAAKAQEATHPTTGAEPVIMEPAREKHTQGELTPAQSEKPRHKKRSRSIPIAVQPSESDSVPKLQSSPVPRAEAGAAPAPGSYYPSSSPLLRRP